MKIFSRFNLFVLIFAMSAVMALSASAATVWSYPWTQDTSPVTQIEAFRPDGGTFGTPGLTGLGASWTVTDMNPGYVTAVSVPASVGTGYTINFGTPQNQQTTVDILEWNGNILQEHIRYVWMATDPNQFTNHFDQWSWNMGQNGSFIDGSLANTLYDRTPIPEPSTYALMGASLAALSFIRRRRQTAGK